MKVQNIIRRGEIRAVTGYGFTALYEMIERGEFPRPVKLGRRAVGWRENDIADWQSKLEIAPASSIGKQLAESRANARRVSRKGKRAA